MEKGYEIFACLIRNAPSGGSRACVYVYMCVCLHVMCDSMAAHTCTTGRRRRRGVVLLLKKELGKRISLAAVEWKAAGSGRGRPTGLETDQWNRELTAVQRRLTVTARGCKTRINFIIKQA